MCPLINYENLQRKNLIKKKNFDGLNQYLFLKIFTPSFETLRKGLALLHYLISLVITSSIIPYSFASWALM